MIGTGYARAAGGAPIVAHVERIMLIAPLVAPIDESTGQLGGAQVLVADLARGLARRGHAVSLLAPRGSRVPGVQSIHLDFDEAALRPASFAPGARRSDDDAQHRAFADVRAWLDAHRTDFDLAHAHAFDAPAFTALRGADLPVLHTLHLPPLDPIVVRAAAEVATEAVLVTVSGANARAWRAAGVEVAAVVPNGIDLGEIRFGPGDGGFLLYAGRLTPEKAPDAAIRVARAVGRPLVLVGGVYDEDFFARAVLPLLGADARYLGRRPRSDVYALMGRATAVLMPVRWDEPFGLVAAEAQAAGAPVVAYRRGALDEIVVDGETGFLVPPEDEIAFARALARLDEIDRGACRRNAGRFSSEAMLAGYEAIYASVLGHAAGEATRRGD